MKKFKEYFENKEKELKDILSIEEVEDQFLRLKEIFNCDIRISYHNNYSIDKNFPKILKELDYIKIRMENMFPVKILCYPGQYPMEKKKDFNIHIQIK